ncbi:MAG: hypothetical protein EOP87_14740 [Verrucomicrobiaceae bacterium]|nr:MAG: hypothetical protein EOP87_14740 [Verrucomicrobiaceae bacterium]
MSGFGIWSSFEAAAWGACLFSAGVWRVFQTQIPASNKTAMIELILRGFFINDGFAKMQRLPPMHVGF